MQKSVTAPDGERQFAIVAGSGFHTMASDTDGKVIKTEFGMPSSPIRDLKYGDKVVYLLARHGDAMLIPPHRINYRANLKALELLGVTDVVALNTVGVITKGLHPGSVAIPEQITDYTYGRDHSIYDGESDRLVNIDFSEPIDPGLRRSLLRAAKEAGVKCHDGGVYAVTQGPRLETAAEVNRLEGDGADFVGMTAMPEASLTMELGMRFACLSLIVNYAAGRGENAIHDDVEASSASAREQSMRVLSALFGTNY